MSNFPGAMLLSVWLAACSGIEGRDVAVARDSAGVQIMENRASARALAWELSPIPYVTIGVLEGAPEMQLFRVASALLLEDRIVVANGGTGDLRYFDLNGQFLSATGRQGDGPGEFRGLAGLYRYGLDSLIAYDARLRRISVLARDGGYARSIQLPRISDTQLPALAGVFGDGTLLVRTGRVFGPGGVQSGLSRDPMLLFRLALDGEVRDTLGGFPGSEAFVQTVDNGFMVTSPGFGRSPSMAVQGEHLYYGASDIYEIAVHAKDGTLVRLIRLARENRPVTTAWREEFKRSRLEQIEDENARRRFESLLAPMPFPSTMPAYSALRVDVEGHVWVKNYNAPGEESNRWTVFDAEGRFLGQIDLPSRFSVLDIGRDYVLGRRVDELDVERVELYRLNRVTEEM